MSLAASSARRHVRWRAMQRTSQMIAHRSLRRRPPLDQSLPCPAALYPPFSSPCAPLASPATTACSALLPASCAVRSLTPPVGTSYALQGHSTPGYDAPHLKHLRLNFSSAASSAAASAPRSPPLLPALVAAMRSAPHARPALADLRAAVGSARMSSGVAGGGSGGRGAEEGKEKGEKGEGDGEERRGESGGGGEMEGEMKSGGEGKANEQSGGGSGGGSNSSSGGRGMRTGPVTWGSLALLLLTGAALLAYFESEKRKRLEAVRELKPVGRAAIGGPFELVDGAGKRVTEGDLKGRWSLLYFGFTFCPDICPSELIKIAQAVDLVEKQAGVAVTPVFISVDPERDAPEQVKEYVKEFHPRMIGLTGTPDQVRAAAKAFRVYYMKTEEEGYDYLVDHSIISYLMSPDFEFVKFFGRNHTPEGLADGIASEIKAHGK